MTAIGVDDGRSGRPDVASAIEDVRPLIEQFNDEAGLLDAAEGHLWCRFREIACLVGGDEAVARHALATLAEFIETTAIVMDGRLLSSLRHAFLIEGATEADSSMPYRDYLASDSWRRAREVALVAAGYRCQLCNAEDALQVHHRTYARRGGEWPSDLTVLCAECHQCFHEHRRIQP